MTIGERLARMEEKFDHLIRTQEDAGRDRRSQNAHVQVQFDQLDKRLEKVETVLVTTKASWRTMVFMTSVYVALSTGLATLAYKTMSLLGMLKP